MQVRYVLDLACELWSGLCDFLCSMTQYDIRAWHSIHQDTDIFKECVSH